MSDINFNHELMDTFYEEVQSQIDEVRKDLSILSEEGFPPGGGGKKESPCL